MRPVASRRSRKWLLPMSRCAVMRPAARSVSPSLNCSRTSAIDPLTSKPEPNGSTPLARRASSFLRRSAISSFSSSIVGERTYGLCERAKLGSVRSNAFQSLSDELVDKGRSRLRSATEDSCWFPTRLPPDSSTQRLYFSAGQSRCVNRHTLDRAQPPALDVPHAFAQTRCHWDERPAPQASTQIEASHRQDRSTGIPARF